MGCTLVKLPDGGSAFVCGGKRKQDHVCDTDVKIMELSDGRRMKETDENIEKYKKKIVAGGLACSVCGYSTLDEICFT